MQGRCQCQWEPALKGDHAGEGCAGDRYPHIFGGVHEVHSWVCVCINDTGMLLYLHAHVCSSLRSGASVYNAHVCVHEHV